MADKKDNRIYYKVEGGWCLHQEAYPVRAEYGIWSCPHPSHAPGAVHIHYMHLKNSTKKD